MVAMELRNIEQVRTFPSCNGLGYTLSVSLEYQHRPYPSLYSEAMFVGISFCNAEGRHHKAYGRQTLHDGLASSPSVPGISLDGQRRPRRKPLLITNFMLWAFHALKTNYIAFQFVVQTGGISNLIFYTRWAWYSEYRMALWTLKSP